MCASLVERDHQAVERNLQEALVAAAAADEEGVGLGGPAARASTGHRVNPRRSRVSNALGSCGMRPRLPRDLVEAARVSSRAAGWLL